MLSSLKLTTFTPLNKDEIKKIKTIWQSLQDNNDSLQFRHPVDWEGMGLVDYPQIVKHPMDLSTINKKLREQRYQSVEEVLDDIQLIWDDCKLYNQQGCWIYDLADKLQKSFKKMVKTFLPAITLPGVPPKPVPAVAPKVEDEFTDRIKVLKPQELGILVQKINELCPKAFKQVQDEKAQILVDLIDSASFKTILTTLQSLQQPQDITLKKQKS